MSDYGNSDLATNSEYDDAMDGDDLQNFSDNEAMEDARLEMESDEMDQLDGEDEAFQEDIERDEYSADDWEDDNFAYFSGE